MATNSFSYSPTRHRSIYCEIRSLLEMLLLLILLLPSLLIQDAMSSSYMRGLLFASLELFFLARLKAVAFCCSVNRAQHRYHLLVGPVCWGLF